MRLSLFFKKFSQNKLKKPGTNKFVPGLSLSLYRRAQLESFAIELKFRIQSAERLFHRLPPAYACFLCG